MKRKSGKFIISAVTHGIMLFIIYELVFYVLMTKYDLKMMSTFQVTFHLFINAGYFLILWFKLYAYDYNYFLHYSREIILRSLASLIVLILTGLAIVFSLNYSLLARPFLLYPLEQNLLVTVCLISCNLIGFVVLYGIQYLWVQHLIKLGYLKKNILIIGVPDARFPVSLLVNGRRTKIFQGNLFRRGASWFHRDPGGALERLTMKNIPSLLCRLKISEVVIFLCDSISKRDLSALLKALSDLSINYYLVPDISKLAGGSINGNSFPYIPIIKKFTSRRDSMVQITVKRCLDLILIALVMLFVLPLGLLIAFLIKAGDGGPVFYANRRVGINGKIIRFFKFRSMVVNADAKKDELLPFNERRDGPLFKMKNDPRHTPIGRIISKWSLDELPQLLNVLKGDMSLVGPRPHLVSEVKEYGARDMLRLECIPGITCLPQIYGRNTIGFRRWIELDLDYRKKWSLFLDMKILIKSVNEVFAPLFRDTF